MTFIEFSQNYPDEASCIKFFRDQKERNGLKCPKCSHEAHYWNEKKKAHDCKKCGYRVTLRSGTVMESSKLPFHYWLYTIYLMTMTKKTFSALEIQKQLGHKRYEPIWAMVHKIRCVMGHRDSKYNLDGVVEVDDAFVKTYEIDNQDDTANTTTNKRGRGTTGHSKILVMAKADPQVGRPKKNKKNSAFRYVKMQVITDSSSETMNEVVQENTEKGSTMKTDGWRGFNKFKEIDRKHRKHIVPPKESSKVLPWVHTMISNLKRGLLGINHKIGDDYLQNYLNEFCYKVNRRYIDSLFDRLVIAIMQDTWYGKVRYSHG